MSNVLSILKGLILVCVIFIIFCFLPRAPRPVSAQACTAPTTPQNVKVTYPNCTGTQCSFTSALCSWTAVSGATNYSVTVTDVDDNTTVQSQQYDANTTQVNFTVTSGKTYKCDVTATNSCGTSPAGTDTLLCKVDGITGAPTATPLPTSPPVATNTPLPTRPVIPPTGSTENVMIAGGIIVLFVLVGTGMLIL